MKHLLHSDATLCSALHINAFDARSGYEFAFPRGLEMQLDLSESLRVLDMDLPFLGGLEMHRYLSESFRE